MKQIFRLIKQWRYKRLYRKLFMHYSKSFKYAYEAANEAKVSFLWLTGEDWENWLY